MPGKATEVARDADLTSGTPLARANASPKAQAGLRRAPEAADLKRMTAGGNGGGMASARDLLFLQGTIGNRATLGVLRSRQLARDTAADPGKQPAALADPHAGEVVSKIVIDVKRGRVGFLTANGMIRGSVSTDLKAGTYKVVPDVKQQRWVFEGGVNEGLRFSVSLQGADPWTLHYKKEVDVIAGEAAAGGKGPINDLDLIKLQDEMDKLPNLPAPAPDANPDHFDSAIYDLDYRSQKGNLSKFLRVTYAGGDVVDMNLDTIAPATPRLLAAKQEALKIMDDYNTLAIEGAFTTIFFILTIDPFVAGIPGKPAQYKATRRIVTRPKIAESAAPHAGGETVPDPALPGGAQAKIRPVNGRVNAGGGLEAGAEDATNLNPINPNSGGPSKGIPNHVKAPLEKIGDVFEEGSVKVLFSNRLRFGDVNWTQAAAGAAKAMPAGGRLSLNVWTGSAEEAVTVVNAFINAGFKQVQALGSGVGTVITGLR